MTPSFTKNAIPTARIRRINGLDAVAISTLAAPTHYGAMLVAGGVAWSAAFLIYLIVYWPMLAWTPRDGRPG